MRKIPAMVDMRRSSADKSDIAAPSMPEYPYGLCLSLGQDELDKLGLSDEVEVGDMLHIHAMAKVTSVSKMDTELSGPSCRVELQITNMVGEDEDSENEAMDTPVAERRSRLYG